MINEERVRELAKCMADLEVAASAIRDKRVAFEATLVVEQAELSLLSETIDNLKATIKDEAAAEFAATGKKKLYGGIGIRCTKTVEYDTAEALAFAKEKDMFLALDAKAFEKVAPGLGLPFVSVAERVTVTFPRSIKIGGDTE